MSNILALDIGGANIKLADGKGYAANWPFPLWKNPERLADQIAHCLAAAPPADQLAVTMTGELCDCYATKSHGVRDIVAATNQAADRKQVAFYQTNGQFVSAETAMATPLLTAASNWHALASFAARFCDGKPGLLVDIGSTTADLIPIQSGREAARGRTDTERLFRGELVYTGVLRSPVCAVVDHLPWRGHRCPVAQELFATTGDAYLLLGELAEVANDTNTADGKPHTCSFAHARLSRMICADSEMVTREESRDFALHVCEAQLTMLERALSRVVSAMPCAPQVLLLSGQGEFLMRRLLERLGLAVHTISLTDELGTTASQCAPAHALAILANELRHFPSPQSPAHTFPLRVVKVGGSLFDLPDLGKRLTKWLDSLPPARNIFLTGGGRQVDEIRRRHTVEPLDEHAAHWMCIAVMNDTARWLSEHWNPAVFVEDLSKVSELQTPWILAPREWLQKVEPQQPGTRLPESWDVSSDSITARLAICLEADELVLLKSAEPPSNDLQSLAEVGYLDRFFPQLAAELPTVRMVNLRISR